MWHCSNYFIHVDNNDEFYDLLILGPELNGSSVWKLGRYGTDEQARKIGEVFSRNLQDSFEADYSFHDRYLSHEDGRTVHISNALELDRTQENFKELLRVGEFKRVQT